MLNMGKALNHRWHDDIDVFRLGEFVVQFGSEHHDCRVQNMQRLAFVALKGHRKHLEDVLDIGKQQVRAIFHKSTETGTSSLLDQQVLIHDTQ